MSHPSGRRRNALISATVASLLLALPGAASADGLSNAEYAADRAEARSAKAAATPSRAAAAPSCEAPPTVQVRTDRYGFIEAPCAYDPELGFPSIRLTDAPDHGNVDVWTNSGYMQYAPDAGYKGTDSVKFVAFNAAGQSQEMTATINVTPTYNTAPQCFHVEGMVHSYETEDGFIEYGHLRARKGATRTAVGYCHDLEGDDISFDVKSAPAEGTLTKGNLHPTAPTLAFTPAGSTPDGTDFSAVVAPTDEHGLAGTDFKVGFTVIAADSNAAPRCLGSGDDPNDWSTHEMGETSPVYNTHCFDADGDTVTLTKVSDPQNATLGTREGGGFTITPAASSGEASFTYKGTDSRGAESAVETVGVKFIAAHADPSCAGASVSVLPGTRTEVELACTDADNDAIYAYLRAENHDQRLLTQHGNVEIHGVKDGKLRLAYTPDAGFTGAETILLAAEDEFDFQATEAKLTLNVGTTSNGGGSNGGGSSGGGTVPTPTVTPEQAKAAMVTFLSRETAEFLQLVGGANKKGIDRSKAILALGTLGADQLPNGGTAQFGVYDKAGAKKLARAAAAKRKLLGSTKVTLAKGQSKKVQVKLNKKGKALLKKKGKVKLTVDAKLTDALTGAQVTQSKTYTFKVKKKKR